MLVYATIRMASNARLAAAMRCSFFVARATGVRRWIIRMAGLAATVCPVVGHRKSVLDRRWFPGRRGMVVRALTGCMARRPNIRMTAGAVRLSRMIEVGWLPGTRRVAVGALARVVIGWLVFRMTRCAVGLAAVVEIGRFPCRRGVAIRALATIMVGRFVLGMAARAIRQSGVIHLGRLPRGCCVTV